MKKGKYPFRTRNPKGSDARRMRRSYMKSMGMFKEVNSLLNKNFTDYLLYLRDTRIQGEKQHRENIEENLRRQKEALSEAEGRIEESFKEFGYSKKEIKEKLSNWRDTVI